MLVKKTIQLLALSALIAFPVGIASAEVRVQTDEANIIVGGGNGVQVYSNPRSANIFRRSLSRSVVVRSLEAAPANILVRNETVSVDDDDYDDDTDVKVYTTPRKTTIIRTPARIYRPNNTQVRTWNRGKKSSMQCNQRSITHRSVQRNSSNRSVNQTYSSQTSTTCN
jgi:hypothetical protein